MILVAASPGPRLGARTGRWRNLLEPRVVIASYNLHVRLLSPGPWLVCTSKVYPGVGADIVMESISITIPQEVEQTAQACAMAFHEKAGRSQVDSGFVKQSLFSRRVATVAMLPSALSRSESFRSVHVGRSQFSRCCHLISDLSFTQE